LTTSADQNQSFGHTGSASAMNTRAAMPQPQPPQVPQPPADAALVSGLSVALTRLLIARAEADAALYAVHAALTARPLPGLVAAADWPARMAEASRGHRLQADIVGLAGRFAQIDRRLSRLNRPPAWRIDPQAEAIVFDDPPDTRLSRNDLAMLAQILDMIRQRLTELARQPAARTCEKTER